MGWVTILGKTLPNIQMVRFYSLFRSALSNLIRIWTIFLYLIQIRLKFVYLYFAFDLVQLEWDTWMSYSFKYFEHVNTWVHNMQISPLTSCPTIVNFNKSNQIWIKLSSQYIIGFRFVFFYTNMILVDHIATQIWVEVIRIRCQA